MSGAYVWKSDSGPSSGSEKPIIRLMLLATDEMVEITLPMDDAIPATKFEMRSLPHVTASLRLKADLMLAQTCWNRALTLFHAATAFSLAELNSVPKYCGIPLKMP